MTVEACAACPHQTDCLKVGACLDDVNARHLARTHNRFPRLMMPAQASQFMEALRAERTLRRICGGSEFGAPIASLTKFRKHCEMYPEWGAEAKRLATVNRKASEKLKGLGASRSGETHCRNGHPYAIYGTFKAKTGPKYAHMKGRLFRYCKACNVASGRKPVEPLPPSTIDKIKDLLRHGSAPHS